MAHDIFNLEFIDSSYTSKNVADGIAQTCTNRKHPLHIPNGPRHSTLATIAHGSLPHPHRRDGV
jgi:hypothetical protein